MLQNAYFVAKIGADTAENKQHSAEILPVGRRVADRRGAAVVHREAVEERGVHAEDGDLSGIYWPDRPMRGG